MSRQPKYDTIESLRLELASYHGLLARWADINGQVAPADVDLLESNRKHFSAWLEQQAAKNRKETK